MKRSIKAVGLTGKYRTIKSSIEKRTGKKFGVGGAKTVGDFDLESLIRCCEVKGSCEVKDSISDFKFDHFVKNYIPYNRHAIECSYKDSMSRIDDSISMPNEGMSRFRNEMIGVLRDIDGKVNGDSIDYSFVSDTLRPACILKNKCIPYIDADDNIHIDLEKDEVEFGDILNDSKEPVIAY